MAVPVLHTFVVGEVATAANINNNTVTLGNFLLQPPLAILKQTVAQSLTSGSPAGLTFDTETVDTDNGHSTVTNTDRYTGATPGWFLCVGAAVFVANATGVRQSWLQLNGAGASESVPMGVPASSGTWSGTQSSGFVFLNGTTDYVRLIANQNSGGALNTDVSSHGGSSLHIQWRST